MKRLLIALLLFVFFLKPAEAFVFSFTNSGIEWGWEGKKHFKFYHTLEMYRGEDFEGASIFGIQGGIYFRWLKLGNNTINLNFSSGSSVSRTYEHFIDPINDGIGFQLYITALAIEPEFHFNDRYSLFMRFPLLQLISDYDRIYGPIRVGFVSNIKIGININLKGQQNNSSSE